MFKWQKIVCSIFIISHLCICTYSEKLPPEKRTIKLHLKAGYVLYTEEKLLVIQHDTTIELPFNADFYIQKKSTTKADSFYSMLRTKAYKHRWSQELHNVILVPESNKIQLSDTVQTQKSEVPFLPFRNVVIRKIFIHKLDVFGPSIANKEMQTKTLLGQTANKIHTKTRDYVIYQHLLFKKGDFIDPYTLADNERLLRELPFIEDARISVENLNSTEDSADVVILSKDNWSKGLDIISPDLKTVSIDFWDNNILGSGCEVDNIFSNTHNSKPLSSHQGYYRVMNINGSFINCKLGYNAYGNQGYSINIWRDFFSQQTKYAGQLSFYKQQTYYRLRDSAFNYNYYNLLGESADLWFGRAFKLNQISFKSTNISNFIVTAGIFQRKFYQQPNVSRKFRYDFHNQTSYLLSYAFSSQGYYKTNLVYNFGRAEDIPFGVLFKFTHGIEVGEFGNRLYNGINLSHGKYIGNWGYLYKSMAFGGFVNNNTFEQGVVKFDANYFSNLFMLKRFKFRTFVNIGYTKGYKRNIDEFLTINDQEGIHGFVSDTIVGDQKLLFNFESVCFTPYYIAGFRFAAFIFADLALIGRTYSSVLQNTFYSGFGLGLRLRNERFVFKTFQIRFAYYPKLPKHAQGELLSINDNFRYRPSNFNVKSPEIVRFR